MFLYTLFGDTKILFSVCWFRDAAFRHVSLDSDLRGVGIFVSCKQGSSAVISDAFLRAHGGSGRCVLALACLTLFFACPCPENTVAPTF